jgi:acetyl-CoA carboxylase, biotin carboxylase subunit
MEMNARIQVEHPVTEMVTGVDLIRQQILVAAGERLSLRQEDVATTGVAIECRINAEDPARNFAPTPGMLEMFEAPAGPWVRVDSGYVTGSQVTQYYDSLIAKLIVWAPDRGQALARMDRALGEFRVEGRGVVTTVDFHRSVLRHPVFRAGTHSVHFVDQLMAQLTAERSKPVTAKRGTSRAS